MTRKETLLQAQLNTVVQALYRQTQRLDDLERYFKIKRVQRTGPPVRTFLYRPYKYKGRRSLIDIRNESRSTRDRE